MSEIRLLRRIVLTLALVTVDPAVDAGTTIRKGSEFQVNARTAGAQYGSSVGTDGQGDFVVAWVSSDGSENGVFARRFSSAGIAQGPEFQVNTYTPNYQENLSLAVDGDGDFVVAWSSTGQVGNGTGVFARRFDSSGVPQGAEFQVNSYSTSAQGADVVWQGGGAFVVAWHSPDGGSYGVFVRRFSSSGVAVAVEMQVNAYTPGSQRQAALAAGSSGDFVATWQSYGQESPTSYGVFARRYSSSGAAVGAEFQVNSYTTGTQAAPQLAADSAGDFVIAWNSLTQDGGNAGVFGRRFDSAGTPLGSEFQINDFTAMNQAFPKVARDGDGDFIVVWESLAQDGGGNGTFARRFDRSGNALAVEFQVNAYTTGTQRGGTVAIRSGDFVIAWASYGQDGSHYGVFAQRFAALATLDIDGNGSYLPLTDALLVLRFLFGFEGDTLIGGAVGEGCTRCTAQAIQAYLVTLLSPAPAVGRGFLFAVLDIDEDGEAAPLTDGLLVIRDAFGFQGAPLVTNAVDTQLCDRCTAQQIEVYLDQLTTE